MGLQKFALIRRLFGVINEELLKYTVLFIMFFVSLTVTTISILNVYNLNFMGSSITVAPGIIFFPLTFIISNIIQEEYNQEVANTVVFTALWADGIMVSMLCFIGILGENQKYYDVFTPLPKVWTISCTAIIISSFLNNAIFKKIRQKLNKGFMGLFISIMTSSVSAETILSCLALPSILMLHEHATNRFSAVILVLGYKILFSVLAAIIYAFVKTILQYKNNETLELKTIN
ncbi:MAG: VUT family protein [Rickettsiales bacterium]|nr:VUT family protein [Silvanigrellaceae bacterium]MBY0580384.1 VUT family protein [Rickettsiales bacterium]